jgi:hypothetical protein
MGRAREMTDNDKPQPIEPKEALLFVPLLGGAIAVCWEIGRLQPYGGFQFFSLSDHLLAALAVLPLGLLLAALTALFVRYMSWHNSQFMLHGNRPKMIVMSGLLLSTSALGWFSHRFVNHFPIDFFLFVSAGVMLFIANLFWLRVPLSSPVALITVFVVMNLATIALSKDRSIGGIERSKSGADLTTLSLRSGTTLQGVVVMIGDHGLLFYEPALDRVSFFKTDDIERAEWHR